MPAKYERVQNQLAFDPRHPFEKGWTENFLVFLPILQPREKFDKNKSPSNEGLGFIDQ